jgi:hypothetical protein
MKRVDKIRETLWKLEEQPNPTNGEVNIHLLLLSRSETGVFTELRRCIAKNERKVYHGGNICDLLLLHDKEYCVFR